MSVTPERMETGVLRALADAVDGLTVASEATSNGFLVDHCARALREVRDALRMVVEMPVYD